MRIPTKIEESGEILDDDGNSEGHAEEGIESEERFKSSFDPNEDQEESIKYQKQNPNKASSSSEHSNKFSCLALYPTKNRSDRFILHCL